MIRILHITFFFFSCSYFCFSQTLFSNVRYQLETGTYLSTSGQTPFWLRSNQYGVVPLESQFVTFRGAAHKEYDSTKNENQKLKKFGIGYGAWAVANVGKVNQLLLPEAYIKVRYGAFEFYGGRKREIVGLVDTTLTSGSYIWSGNALPIPKIQISIPNYTSIVGHGLVSIKGNYAHGWFGSSDSTKNFFLHQKSLYGRIGKPNWRIKMYAGFNHQVQWGGRPYKPYIEKQTGKLITSYGNDFNTYLNVITGIPINRKGNGLSKNGTPINDALNRTGNHLGSIDIATEINFNKFDLLIYRQSIYDDGSLFYLGNVTDGVLGISYKRKNKNMGLIKITLEFLDTRSQGGLWNSESTIPQIRGGDNYFNNSFYQWIYNGNTIGTPSIIPLRTIKKEFFSTNYAYISKSLPSTYMVVNKLSGIFLAAYYRLKEISFLTKFSHTNNQVYDVLKIFNQTSTLQSVEFPYKKNIISSQISYDSNGLFRSNLSICLQLRRTF
jgi:hypothetical protein